MSSPVATTPPDEARYDPLAVGAYAEHLSDINKTNQVVAGQDIFNSQGMLLIKKGQPISEEMVQRIVQFKLMRPLETSIEIENSLTAAKLLAAIEQSLLDQSTRDVFQTVREEIADCCRFVFQYPLLGQKLTVLALQMPQEYAKALTVAWTCFTIGKRMRLPKEECAHLFIAGLMHDIGMLHIPREIVAKEGGLTPQEWRAIKSHTIIGQKILQQVEGLPAAIATAVLEHHEMSDGTGYPVGKFGAELSLAGQIVGILDSVFAIYFNKLAPRQLGTRFVAPILQINSSSYRADVYSIVIKSLREHAHPEVPLVPADAVDAFLANMAADADVLKNYHAQIAAAMDGLAASGSQKRIVRAAQTLSEQLQILLRRSGIVDGHYFSDLAQSLNAESRQLQTDLQEAYLMLQELRFLLVKLTRIGFSITEDDTALKPEQRQLLQRQLQELPSLSQQAMDYT